MAIKTLKQIEAKSDPDRASVDSPLLDKATEPDRSTEGKTKKSAASVRSPAIRYTIVHSDFGEIKGEFEIESCGKKLLMKDGIIITTNEEIKDDLIFKGYTLLTWKEIDDNRK